MLTDEGVVYLASALNEPSRGLKCSNLTNSKLVWFELGSFSIKVKELKTRTTSTIKLKDDAQITKFMSVFAINVIKEIYQTFYVSLSNK